MLGGQAQAPEGPAAGSSDSGDADVADESEVNLSDLEDDDDAASGGASDTQGAPSLPACALFHPCVASRQQLHVICRTEKTSPHRLECRLHPALPARVSEFALLAASEPTRRPIRICVGATCCFAKEGLRQYRRTGRP